MFQYCSIWHSTKIPGYTTIKNHHVYKETQQLDSIEQIDDINPEDRTPKFSKFPLSCNILKEFKENAHTDKVEYEKNLKAQK